MALSYRRSVTTYVDQPIGVPLSFGFYSKEANREMGKIASRLYEAFDRPLDAPQHHSLTAKLHFAYEYLKAADALRKKYPEGYDTAVRECIWYFLQQVGECVGLDYDLLDDVWNEVMW